MKAIRRTTAEQALAEIMERLEPPETRVLPVLAALDYVLAADVCAATRLPLFDSSAMDGYAVRAEDLPAHLPVVGESRAGHPAGVEVQPGTAVRIMTGAVVPPGADAVVPYENVTVQGETVSIRGLVPRGANIRRQGEDISDGQLLFSRGGLIGPAEVAVLCAIGRETVDVYRRPRVAVFATGDELVAPGAALDEGQIFNTNGPALAAQVVRAGGEVATLGAVRDSGHALREALRAGLEADVLITAGGVSGGAYDIVADVLREEGSVETLEIRMKPGKPLAVGWLAGRGGRTGKLVPYIGLPGNPIASMVGFELFARPAIMALRGLTTFDRPSLTAIAGAMLENASDRDAYFRVRVDSDGDSNRATPVGSQRSHAMSSLLGVNALAVVPGGGIREGDPVTVRLVDWSGAAAWPA